ncbi:CARDB domain-containing protein [Chloroflexota bacterium]
MSILILALCLISIGDSPIFAQSLDDYFTYGLDVDFSKTEIQGDETFSATVVGTATNKADLPLAAIQAQITSRVVAEHQVSGARVTLNSSYSVTIETFPSVVGETSTATEVVSLSFPDGAESGVYNVIGELVEARVQFALIGWLVVTSFLPSTQEMGSVTYTADAGGGVGGGGGIVIIEPEGGITDYVDEDGVFTDDVTTESEDSNCWIIIDEGTTGLTEDGDPLTEISIIEVEQLPTIPEDFQANVIGLAYDIEPDGATFDPPMILTLEYNSSQIPDGVSESNLVIAIWDEETDEWVDLDCSVDTGDNTITAEIAHLTDFTILAHTRPAAFSASNLYINPADVGIGENVVIGVLITNTGDLAGSYDTVLKIDDVEVETKEVTLSGNDNDLISFSITPDAAGVYTIGVDGLSEILEVNTQEVTTPEIETPSATFAVANLDISPAEVKAGENVDISITVTNTSALAGTHEVTLKIDDVPIETRKVPLAGGDGQIVTFSITQSTAGTYKVNMGGLAGSFTVNEEAPPSSSTERINWPVLGGIIGGVILVGLLVFFLIRRRRIY